MPENVISAAREPEVSINICDLPDSFFTDQISIICENIEQIYENNKIGRIYTGSYFCPNYFLKKVKNLSEKSAKLIKEKSFNITLVIPIASQRYLADVKKAIKDYISQMPEDVIDEIVVNDLGMLKFICETINADRKYKITLGRLFFKQLRDARSFELENSISVLPFSDIFEVINKNERQMITAAEIDISSEAIDTSELGEDILFHVHTPFSYMTYGNICESASVHLPVSHKFRAGSQCNCECENLVYDNNVNLQRFIKSGRAVYFPHIFNENISFVNAYTESFPARYIYFPLQEYIETKEVFLPYNIQNY